MSRSSKKGPYIDERLLAKVNKARSAGAEKKVIKTWSRSATITPEMVGVTFGVHNGKNHIDVFVVENMVGHKLGEFSPTKKFVRHGGRMQKEQEQAASASSAPKKEPKAGASDTKSKS